MSDGHRKRKSSTASGKYSLEHARRHIGRLYDVTKLLARFESVDQTLPRVLALASETLHVQVAILVEGSEGRPRTFVWHSPAVDAGELEAETTLALSAYDYLVTPGTLEAVALEAEPGEGLRVRLETINGSEPNSPRRTITVPLVVDRGPVFGVLRVKCGSALDEVDVAFLNAVGNTVAIALGAHHARRKEAALRRAAEASLAGERAAVQARDAFISVASHELKNPIHVLGLQLEMILATSRDEVLGRKLGVQKRHLARMARLVDSLLDVSRITAGRLDLELEDVELLELVDEVVARTADELERAGCTLTLRRCDPVIGLWDRLRLDQVVTNLLSNAMKYGSAKPIELSVERDAERVRLAVRDHGVGISPLDQARIFHQFERVGDAQQFTGFGLGLWIVHHIVNAMGGTVRVESAIGQGSTFTVELPRRHDLEKLAQGALSPLTS